MMYPLMKPAATGFFGRTTMLFLAVAIAAMTGCGKKGPPVAPRSVPLPAVTDLEAKIEDGAAVLTWTPPQETGPEDVRVAGFSLNRSKTSLADAACLDCPILFERLADIPVTNGVPAGSEKKAIRYVDPLEQGYRYIYQVQIYTAGGELGPESNRVELIY